MPAVLSDGEVPPHTNQENTDDADALNRYRITHPDKELRALLRRIYLLPGLGATTPTDDEGVIHGGTSEGGEADAEMEREITRIEVLKWKASVERVMASAKNLGRQGERYRQRAEETCEC
jgi:phosphatidylinositol glycan class S